MKVDQFSIKNFKGISAATIAICDPGAPGNVTTLIGLNESGKTTILEAISYFVTEDQDTASLVGTVQPKAPLQDLIPKDSKAAFTGRVSIEATVRLDSADVDALSKVFRDDYKLILDTSALPDSFTVERGYQFEDSRYVKTHTIWSIAFQVKSKKQKKFDSCGGADNEANAEMRKIWLAAISVLRERLPKVVYFPTLLFNFPDRIYLAGDDEPVNDYYVKVLQDVLDSLGEGLRINRHVVERISRVGSEANPPNSLLAQLFGRDEKKQIDAVFQKASNRMSEVIFGSWNQILGRSIAGKRVQIEWFLDPDKNNAAYIELSIVDGQSRYSLSERSLGFRWFFSFLLFTQFRGSGNLEASTIFLFDEPAANLHSRPQMKLLDSFGKIATKSTHIIYSTHSHYMINPLWLEKAYIVQNSAIDYDNEADEFSVRKTDIKAVKYKTFVGSYPSRTTYFQPVLDALDVAFSPLVKPARALIVEGKYDYHPLFYLGRARLKGCNMPDVYPGGGANDLGHLISLFRGWGVDFVLLLDGDPAGKAAKEKYAAEYLLADREIKTLADVIAGTKNRTFEALYQDDVVEDVRKQYGVPRPAKKHYSLYFQELLAAKKERSFDQTEAALAPVFDWIQQHFSS